MDANAPIRAPQAGREPYYYSFTMNDTFCNPRYKFVQVRGPADKALLVEESEQTINDGHWVHGTNGNLGSDVITDRHNGRGSILFCDGHVKSMTPTEAVANPSTYDPWN